MEAWLKDEYPADHFNGTDLLKIDLTWYPQEAEGRPALASNPYRFQVVIDESPPESSGPPDSPAAEAAPDAKPVEPPKPAVVFGYSLDLLPGLLIVGYNQFKHKAVEAGLNVTVSLAPLNNLPPQAAVLFVPRELAELAQQTAPNCHIEVLDNFLNQPIYNEIIKRLRYSHAEEHTLSA